MFLYYLQIYNFTSNKDSLFNIFQNYIYIFKHITKLIIIINILKVKTQYKMLMVHPKLLILCHYIIVFQN